MNINGYTITPIALAPHGPMAQITQHHASQANDRLLIADMATTDEGAHTPAASVQIFGRPALINLRDALLSLYPVFSLEAHLQRQAAFSLHTFGPGARVEGVTDHIAKELKEVRDSGGDLKEWVDVIILGFDGAWRSGATPAQIIEAIVAKQAKNESRTWPDWRTAEPGKAIEHDRAHD
ncbi:MAG: dATP/dGTP pyrophosphohydrolase domain-containing protein [Steroidobacteraceae bacterium]